MAPPGNVDMDLGGFALLQLGVGADKIYGWFKDGKGPEQTTDASQRDWEQVNRDHVDIAYLINKAVRDSGASWEGAAGDQARASTTPLASWSEAAGTSAHSASTSTSDISDSFRLARNSVEKPVDVPDKPWYNDGVPWDTDYDDAVEKSQEVNSRNMRVLNTYGTAANAAGAAMPTFQSPDEVGAGIDERVEPPIVERPKEWEPKPVEPKGRNGDDSSGGDDTRTQWGEPTVPPPNPPGGNDDGTTRTSFADVPERPVPPPLNVDPPRVQPPPPNDPRFPPFDPRMPYDPRNPNDPRNRNNPRIPPISPRNPAIPPVRLPAANSPGGGPGGGRGGMGGIPGGGPGGGGGRMPGVPGPGPGGFGPGGFGPGGASGVAPGERGFGPQSGFGPGGAGAAGRGGPGGMASMAGMGAMGAGAGKGQGEDDVEHKSAPYLQGADDIFDDGTMVAPPVIGE
ncbi:hypothetical protein AB0I60_15850 [Actinosynnema sp. NPDC050436]|uniref:hypothetical protein n=1 Tax=Actinosynnema sp. NPDC050436 TaxID=3155659 RepID=UPI003411A19A